MNPCVNTIRKWCCVIRLSEYMVSAIWAVNEKHASSCGHQSHFFIYYSRNVVHVYRSLSAHRSASWLLVIAFCYSTNSASLKLLLYCMDLGLGLGLYRGQTLNLSPFHPASVINDYACHNCLFPGPLYSSWPLTPAPCSHGGSMTQYRRQWGGRIPPP